VKNAFVKDQTVRLEHIDTKDLNRLKEEKRKLQIKFVNLKKEKDDMERDLTERLVGADKKIKELHELSLKHLDVIK